MNTPWGKSDSKTTLAKGISWVGTPSHGGFAVTPTAARINKDEDPMDVWPVVERSIEQAANVKEAIRWLRIYTNGRFDFWMLAGSPKASCRAHILSVLLGVKTPQSKSGVNALREAFYQAGNIEGDCLAAKEENFLKWVRKETEAR